MSASGLEEASSGTSISEISSVDTSRLSPLQKTAKIAGDDEGEETDESEDRVSGGGGNSEYNRASVNVDPRHIYHLENGQEIVTVRRACEKVVPARSQLPTDEQLFSKDPNGGVKPNTTFLKTHFFEEGKLSNDQLLRLIQMGTDVLRAESNVLRMDAPIIGK